MVLYHASQAKDLKVLKPQKTLSDNVYIGDYVFATADKKLAIMYLVPKGIPILMNPAAGNANIVICADEKQFIEQDKGGAIYELPPGQFVASPQKALSEYEMVSTHPVKPLNKKVYASTLRALLDSGVKIRFVGEQTFKSLIRKHAQEP